MEILLRDLQAVVSARHLYPADHPRLAGLVGRVVAHVATLTEARPELSVFLADNRLVFDDVPLPNGEALARSVFAALRAQGFHRLTLRRGLPASEVLAFAASVAKVPSEAGAFSPLQSSAHVRLSAIDSFTDLDETGRLEFSASPIEGHSLERVWDGVLGQRRLDLDATECMVLALGQTLEANAAAMLPMAALKAHDDYTVAHITNVALLTTAFGEALGFGPAALRELGIAALLHDIGKLRVPAAVLNETDRLTDEQRALIRRHPEEGARILLGARGVPELAAIVAFEHHMHVDGTGGYPMPPRPWTMNLASEMTHIADVFDALRSNRPYRAGLPRDRIAAIMRRDAGTVFDPTLVGIFLDTVAPRAANADTAAVV
jgi:HD-GYP domain-containing protein (c-di-GMP phosphodiesterase class II)